MIKYLYVTRGKTMKMFRTILSVYYKIRNRKFYICTEKEWRSLNKNKRQEILNKYNKVYLTD